MQLKCSVPSHCRPSTMERCGRCRKVGAIGGWEERFDQAKNFSGEMVVLEPYHHECRSPRSRPLFCLGWALPRCGIIPRVGCQSRPGLATISIVGINSPITITITITVIIIIMSMSSLSPLPLPLLLLTSDIFYRAVSVQYCKEWGKLFCGGRQIITPT